MDNPETLATFWHTRRRTKTNKAQIHNITQKTTNKRSKTDPLNTGRVKPCAHEGLYVSVLPVSMNFLLDFETVPMVWYFSHFYYILQWSKVDFLSDTTNSYTYELTFIYYIIMFSYHKIVFTFTCSLTWISDLNTGNI